jgi:hypothetical protein
MLRDRRGADASHEFDKGRMPRRGTPIDRPIVGMRRVRAPLTSIRSRYIGQIERGIKLLTNNADRSAEQPRSGGLEGPE